MSPGAGPHLDHVGGLTLPARAVRLLRGMVQGAYSMGNRTMTEKFEKGVPLKHHTSFKLGGAAKYFFTANTAQDIIDSIKWAKKESAPFFVLGGGSNLLVSDNGFDGLVIKIESASFEIRSCNSGFSVCVYAEAGVKLDELLQFCLKQSLAGLEWAAGIPRITVGGAVRGSASAFGQKMTDIVKEIEFFDASALETKTLTNKECEFDYKESIFKKNPNFVILSALLILNKKNKKEIEKEINMVLEYRRAQHPSAPSAGCVFKNPNNETSAAELIERAGLKGEKIGKAQISEKHSNFIVNLGGASSDDVLGLIKLAKAKVKEKFNIELEEEIQYLGF